MAAKITYKSEKAPYLAFYVNGERKRFYNGTYTAETKAEQDVLDGLSGVTKVAEESAETKAEAKTETKPGKPKQKATQKAKAKTESTGKSDE